MQPEYGCLRAAAEARGLDPDDVIERVAIMTEAGDVPSYIAERYALGYWTDAKLEQVMQRRMEQHGET
jgi:hypothetical protein